jgi:hypothetical protein
MNFYPHIPCTLIWLKHGTDLHTVLLIIVIFMKVGVVKVAVDARAYIKIYPHFPSFFSDFHREKFIEIIE